MILHANVPLLFMVVHHGYQERCIALDGADYAPRRSQRRRSDLFFFWGYGSKKNIKVQVQVQ